MLEKIEELKGQLTGNFMQDMDLKDEIHRLEMKGNDVSPSCSMDEGCISCGS